MIQRIQTVYLSLAIIALSLLYFFPMAYFYSEKSCLRFYLTGVKNMAPDGAVPLSMGYISPLILCVLVIAILAGIAIAGYKNRPKQIQFTNIAVMLNILFILAIMFIYIPLIERRTGIKPDYASGMGIYLPIVSLMFLVLANRAIRRDEKLVRSSERLR